MSNPVPDLLEPPRLTGDSKFDTQALVNYSWVSYRALRIALDRVSTLGTLATQDASNVSISGGTVSATIPGGELTANKNATSGYAGLSASFQIQFENTAGTFTSLLTNANSAIRTYTFPDASGTMVLTSDLSGFESTSAKNAVSGYAGLSASYQIQFKNTAGSFISLLTNTNTAIRTYTFQDASGTIAFTSDLSGFESTSNKNAASGYAGLSASFQIQFKNTANTFTSLLTNTNSAARTYTFKDAAGTVAFVTDITGGTEAAAFTSAVLSGLRATSAAAPTIASAATIAPTKEITFISGVTTIQTITPPALISSGGGQITLVPTGLWATNAVGNIALATTAVVGKALILTYDTTTTKWYPSY